MGLFDSFFKKEEHPPLSESNPAFATVNAIKGHLEPVLAKVSDRLEIIPGPDVSYLIIGKPEKQFGLVWVESGKVSNLKNLIDDHKVPQPEIISLTGKVAGVYDRHKNSERYSVSIGGKTVFVMPSDSMRDEIKSLVEQVKNA